MARFNRVLITGGTGFFGNAMTKFLLDKNLAEIVCIFSRDEYKQSVMRRKFGNDERLRFFIGDVRDLPRLTRAMAGVDLVIHAAALKRIEVGVSNPDELVKTNVIGTQNVVDAALSVGANAVLLSTDKACEPVSAYGYSKALAEAIFQAAGEGFAITRYGNVANSTGSVIPLWRDMIDNGVFSVPVTDPACTRFYMTEGEAVLLVMNTALTMPKDIVIPTLPAYQLEDLADALSVEMDVIGLPAWEKRHESMTPGYTSENARRMSVVELREAINNV
jgi:UDP-N-acetylglucosamine 4,6-dehydratase